MRSILVFMSVVLAGCASTASTPSGDGKAATRIVKYTQKQKTDLTYCLGLVDTAWSIATMKLAGKSKEQVRAAYPNHPNPTLINAEIDEIFDRTFTHAWDFSVEFFRECAVNVADVAPDSTGTGAYCLQNAMLSGLAQEQKSAGRTKQQAIEGLPIQGDTPRSLVEKVYAGTQTRSVAMMNAWNACMDPMVLAP